MHPRYHEWLPYVFNHPVSDPAWYFDLDRPDFVVGPTDCVELLTLTFRRAGTDLTGFTDAQVNQGLWFIVSPAVSDYMFPFRSTEVPVDSRVRAIESIHSLYAECFAKRCSETLGHLSEPSSDLNPICYMFWDICPLSHSKGAPDREAMEDAVFSVLQKTLTIPHRACREGALHGLGEIAPTYRERIQGIIDSFLRDYRIDEALRAYALNAKDGHIL